MRLSPVIATLAFASNAFAAARKYYPDKLTAVAKTNTDINELSVNAINGFFSVGYSASTLAGGPPTTSCPSTVENCPPGNVTAIIYSRDQAALDAEVPGGQYIFVDKRGMLGYSAPYAGIIPKNATATGFYVTGPEGSDPRGRFHFRGRTAMGMAQGFVACPSADYGSPYHLMVKFDGFYEVFDRNRQCTEVELALSRYGLSQAAAWQYDVSTGSQ